MFSLGIIPARKGSKRIPHKNMVELGGRPLIDWTFEAALKSKLDDIIVSTDDDAVKHLACKRGIPIMCRPPALAGDDVDASTVIVHTLQNLAVNTIIDILNVVPGQLPDAVCMLLPTSPFRTGQHIDEALELFAAREDPDASVISVMLFDPDISRRLFGWRYDNYIMKHSSRMFLSNGAIQISSARSLHAYNGFWNRPSVLAYQMDGQEGLDIDTPTDLMVARELYAQRYAT